jgi:outer membrane lipoprotein
MSIAKNLFRLMAAVSIVTLTGCATIPQPLAGDFAEFQPDQATERSIGARVRWGGHIVDTRPGEDQTCVEILARDLDRDMRPVRGDHQYGRFLACRDGFQDPAVFTQGREITVTGVIADFTDRQIGEFAYRYPRLDAHTLYLWPIRPDVVTFYHAYPYYDPWWPYRYPYHRHPRTRVSGTVIITR